MPEWLHKTIIGALLGVIGFFLIQAYGRLMRIEFQLAELQIDIAKMRILTAEDVRSIVHLELYKIRKVDKIEMD